MIGFNNGLCRDCVYCVDNSKEIYCEYDKFEPTTPNKSKLFSAVDFDCEYFEEREV